MRTFAFIAVALVSLAPAASAQDGPNGWDGTPNAPLGGVVLPNGVLPTIGSPYRFPDGSTGTITGSVSGPGSMIVGGVTFGGTVYTVGVTQGNNNPVPGVVVVPQIPPGTIIVYPIGVTITITINGITYAQSGYLVQNADGSVTYMGTTGFTAITGPNSGPAPAQPPQRWINQQVAN